MAQGPARKLRIWSAVVRVAVDGNLIPATKDGPRRPSAARIISKPSTVAVGGLDPEIPNQHTSDRLLSFAGRIVSCSRNGSITDACLLVVFSEKEIPFVSALPRKPNKYRMASNASDTDTEPLFPVTLSVLPPPLSSAAQNLK
jgi:hypothetical protein